MSFVERLKRARDSVGNLTLASTEISEGRLAICKECPSLQQPLMTCKECGCFMLAKTKLKNVSCPLGKW